MDCQVVRMCHYVESHKESLCGKELLVLFQVNRKLENDICKGNTYISNYKYVRDLY